MNAVTFRIGMLLLDVKVEALLHRIPQDLDAAVAGRAVREEGETPTTRVASLVALTEGHAGVSPVTAWRVWSASCMECSRLRRAFSRVAPYSKMVASSPFPGQIQ